ncbi:MAG: hypothetical protein WB626_03530 [Bacteroidota bacterium]
MTYHMRADLSRVRTISVRSRRSMVRVEGFARPFDGAGGTFAAFARSLPRFLAARDLHTLVEDIRRARRTRKPVLVLMGAHVVKVGLNPVLVDLLRRRIITAVAMNSAAAIHDVETALWGRTSEDVAAGLRTGRFGMARETAEFINSTLREAVATDLGYGEALGMRLLAERAPRADRSILAVCCRLRVPLTVHAAIGTDTIHQQPSMDGAATGEMTFRDFRSLAHTCGGLTGGGVVLNIGSAVILPEVFLKALTVARNLGSPARGFTTAVFDMLQHYRPHMNVQARPTQDGGRGFYFTGHHEIMIPLLAAMITARR